MKIPGIADINAHLFDAFIQTPHRFAKTSQLWKYCRLSITDRSSDGKPLGYQRIDRDGIGLHVDGSGWWGTHVFTD